MHDHTELDSSMGARFDRLVDGELSPAEYRALLAALDDEPNGWRQCALAFLEQQAWAGDLTAIRQAPNPGGPDAGGSPPQPGGSHDLPPPRHRSPHDLGTMLAVAASFLVAFALGVAAPRLFERRPQDDEVAGNSVTPSPLAATAGGAATGERRQAPRPVGNLRLVMDGAASESPQAGRVPVYEVEQNLEQYLENDVPALAPELVQMLQQRGHDVQRQQQYIPVQLDDGRQIVVPVDGYQITPVGRRVY